MSKKRSVNSKWIVVGLIGAASLGFAQAGDLEPQGPPAPTMKTLAEVEPRKAIHAADLPLIILAPGSYYLAENITTAGGGIAVGASNVSIDLMGFALEGGTGSGISTLAALTNISIANGTIAGWAEHGIGLQTASNVQVSGIRAYRNGDNGVYIGSASTIVDSIAESNNGHGLYAGTSSSVSRSVARDNGGIGVLVTTRSAVREVVAHSNDGHGIQVSIYSSVTDSLAANSGGYGINVAGASGKVEGCTVSGNLDHGIRVFANSTVVGNNVGSHIAAGTAGIYTTGDNNRIDGNHVVGNDTGIETQAGSTDNVIVRNSSRNNNTSYAIVGGNHFILAFNLAGAGPWHNFDL